MTKCLLELLGFSVSTTICLFKNRVNCSFCSSVIPQTSYHISYTWLQWISWQVLILDWLCTIWWMLYHELHLTELHLSLVHKVVQWPPIVVGLRLIPVSELLHVLSSSGITIDKNVFKLSLLKNNYNICPIWYLYSAGQYKRGMIKMYYCIDNVKKSYYTSSWSFIVKEDKWACHHCHQQTAMGQISVV